MIRIFYPKSIYKLLDALSKHKVYIVGGFVRDLLRSGHGGEFFPQHHSVVPVVTGSCTQCLEHLADQDLRPHFAQNKQPVCSIHLFSAPKRLEVPETFGMPPLYVRDIDLVTKDSLDTFLPSIQALSKKHHIMEHYQAIQFSFEGYQVNLTRLRYDATCDGRQADVIFVDTLQEDIWRRDFTVNTLYADEEGQVVDFLDGVQDLEKKIVRFIGDPEARIKEDLLRILRYVRFCSLLGASMDPHILDLMHPYIPQLESLSQDLLQREIKKIRKLPLGRENLARLKI